MNGSLSSVLLAKPNEAIERAAVLPGEPGAIYARALEQHAVLCSTLEYFGVETVLLDSVNSDAYETAVGDAAVVFAGGGAAIMRPTGMSRRAEADRVSAKFANIEIPIAGHITPPGLLDGNDVLLIGETAFIGVGSRGNDLGRSGFARLAEAHGYRTIEVKLAPGVEALRSVVGALAKDTVVIGADKADHTVFDGFRTIVLERGEELAAGVLYLDDRHVLADLRYRTALAAMRRAGITVEAIDLYDFGKLGMTPSMLALVLKRE